MVGISIIMPVYNAEKFIEKSCESVNNQIFKDIELICINDGSTDNSLSKLYELKEKYNFIKILTQENKGSGKARNYGMDNACGEYIAFLDADDIFIDEDALEKMYNVGIKHNADMVGGNLKRVSIDGKLEDNFNYKEGNYAFFSKFDVIKPEDYGVPWAFYKNIFKREFLNNFNIRFPDLKRGQDPVLLANVLVNIDKIYVAPVDLYGYNYAAGGGANSKVDDYTKKFDFIKHYKDTFVILESAGFNNVSNKYKELLAIYLKLNRNKNDQELQDIVWEIFCDNVYFDKFKYHVFNLMVPNSMDKLIKSKSDFDKNYSYIKKSFFNMSFIDDYFTDYETMKNYLSIDRNNISENLSLVPILKINKKLTDKQDYLNSKKEDLNELIQSLRVTDDNVYRVIMDDMKYSLFNKDFIDLKIEALKIILETTNFIEYELMERYIILLNDFKHHDDYSDFLDNYHKKLVIENEYLIKQKKLLKQDLVELKSN